MQYTPIRSWRFYDTACFDPITVTTMAVASAATTMAGAGVSAMGTIAGGNAAYDAGVRTQQGMEFKAKGEEQAGQEAFAVAQRNALGKRDKANLMLSSLRARAAASGGGADDPGVLTLAEGIGERGELEALEDMANGINRKRGLEDAAIGSRLAGDAAVAEGRAKKSASKLSALGTVIGGAGTAMSQFSGKKA